MVAYVDRMWTNFDGSWTPAPPVRKVFRTSVRQACRRRWEREEPKCPIST